MEVNIHTAQKTFPAREPGDVGEARRAAVALAGKMGFDENLAGKLALVVTEAGTNLLKHARGGEIVIGATRNGPDSGVEVIALDRGPGMMNSLDNMRDGMSTSGTPGHGLGAIRRLSSEFDLYSRLGAGTVLISRVLLRASGQNTRAPRFRVGAVCVPVNGEACSGDGWGFAINGELITIMMVDGLGHGLPAFEAAQAVLGAFEKHPASPPEDLLHFAHAAARSSRGAAAAVALIKPGEQLLWYAGIGNISGSILARSGTSRSMISHHGVLGGEVRKIQAFQYPWQPDSMLIMHSDGLGTKWDLAGYPGLHGHDPSVIAGVLYRDFARERDDTSVLACTIEGAA